MVWERERGKGMEPWNKALDKAWDKGMVLEYVARA